MKYLKENNGIMEYEEKDGSQFVKHYFVADINVLENKEPNIFKESDKLEYLMDYYVCIDAFKQYHFVEGKIPFDNIKNTFKGMTIYGAIWTGKGLIFASKMNNNGELELL